MGEIRSFTCVVWGRRWRGLCLRQPQLMVSFHPYTCQLNTGARTPSKGQPHLTLSNGFYLLKIILVNLGSNLGIVLVPSWVGARKNWDNILIFPSLTRRLIKSWQKIMAAFTELYFCEKAGTLLPQGKLIPVFPKVAGLGSFANNSF